ncbi:helicase [Tessaracoccus flavus]|uniref:Helicase n=2 Tax=Tessaracoccus flavus TaxID=1610493 RepID=A0A1Q2CF03_9ACTN|nr:helicase [Tessaracoccus flavus]
MSSTNTFAPGNVVVVRDEDWLITSVDESSDGPVLNAQGLSDLVRGQDAVFYPSLDRIKLNDPRDTQVRADDSPKYRRSRLWVESTLRKTAVPLSDDSLTVSPRMLARQLGYQHKAVAKALDPATLRPRILLADAVGLGKTLEIGMILSELIRRGRGERILVVTPRHVLEQMQHEMWSRFAIPFVRLDSQGVARVKQKLPANRNPFSYFRRVIISIDTLKQERFVHDLRRHHWDAVVIDESHNVTNTATLNNRLASILAPQADALILASATPHNGSRESFAELVRLLDPTAVKADGDLDAKRVEQLTIRRHRHSAEVAEEVGADWAERLEPDNRLIDASPQEDAVVDELVDTWLRPTGSSPYSGANGSLFPWTLAKAFLSSPAALRDTLHNRIERLDHTPAAHREAEALRRLAVLNDATMATSSKYQALVAYLRDEVGVGKTSPMRAVVFSERVATLHWLQAKLQKDLGLKPDQVEVLHGGLADDQQQAIVESFKQTSSPIRVLVTGDVASEGVNLHKQCHHLIHYDIPWSLIRIEQRNGRIDRYGQKQPPQITTLLLNTANERFSGDIRVLTALVAREHEAHRALGDAASLMGRYSVTAEEEAIRQVLAGSKSFDDVVASPEDIDTSVDDWLAQYLDDDVDDQPEPAVVGDHLLYAKAVDFLRDALHEYYPSPEDRPLPRDLGGVDWREHQAEHIVEFVPPADLRQRFEVLPQSYLADRNVLERLQLVTEPNAASTILDAALTDTSASSWPEAHYLGPLHPVLDWAADRALARLARGEIFAVRGNVDVPTVLLNGTLINRRGQVVASSWLSAQFHGATPFVEVHATAGEMLTDAGVIGERSNPGPVQLPDMDLVRPAVERAEDTLRFQFQAAADAAKARVDEWVARAEEWQSEAEALIQRDQVRRRRALVDAQERLSRDMTPDRQLVRPLLVVLPADTPEATHG